MAYNKNIYTKGTALYTDFDLSLKLNPLTKDCRKKTDAEAIKQSLKNLLLTNKLERPFQPNLYGGLNDLLFAPLDRITTEVLKNRIQTVILNSEPRIKVLDIQITDVKDDTNSLNITLKYSMLNVRQPETISIILQRVR